MRVVLLSLVIQEFLTLGHSASSHLIPPVILVPGDGGCQIEARVDSTFTNTHPHCHLKPHQWVNVWFESGFIVAPKDEDFRCWLDYIALVYNNTTRHTTSQPGVETRVPGFGNTTTVETLNPELTSFISFRYLADMVEALVHTLGYQRGHTVRAAPYDFRKAPNEQAEYLTRLQTLIEDTYQSTGGRRVVLAAHSLGGSLVLYFLTHQPQEWKDRYLEALVTLSGAWGGGVKAVKVYAAGDNLGSTYIDPLKIRAEQRSTPSLAFLLPSRDLWSPEEVIVTTKTNNYTAHSFREFLGSLKLPDAYNMYLDTRDLLKGAPPPGVPIYCLYGVGIPTVEKLTYTDEDSFPNHPTLTYGDGDGTLNIRSAELCKKWVGKQKEPVVVKAFPKVEHMEIVTSRKIINYFLDLLKGIMERNEEEWRKRSPDYDGGKPGESMCQAKHKR
ncbi:hypothetical protein Pcinc_034009 [Petrolisthes cinctipes]|uniref:Group XV phospholipase A2 n=1 Tax=Petrolisthes cinctipes TaxID=88211 RepID=A0AAE1ER30_PETCI|nr:hypothetical protein Pcinc_034009 [Petrolisthes cinctipes]